MNNPDEQPNIGNVTPINIDDGTTELLQNKIQELSQHVTNLEGLNNQFQTEIVQLQTKINSFETSKKMGEVAKDLSSKLPQICKINTNNKWYITIILAIIVLFFTSTYSVGFIDRLLDRHNVDLFSTRDKMNELLLLIIQFIIIVIVIRLILESM